MADITTLSIGTAYLAALLFFVAAMLVRGLLLRRRASAGPPAMPVGKVPVWFYRPIDLLGVAGIAGLFGVVALANASVSASTVETKITVEGLVVSIGFQFFTAAIAVVAVIHRIRISQWLGLVWRQWPLAFAIAPVTVVSMWALFAGLYGMGYMDLMDRLGVEQVQETVRVFQNEKDVVVLALMAIAAVVVAPVCEEVVFRGYLYPAVKRFVGPWVAALCSALVFSAAHGNLSALLPLFVFGLALVAIYEWTGSIWAPVAVHFLFNLATVFVQLSSRYLDLPTAHLP